jgi:DhnA family fructose-bisphosphate aldolase class Ia
MAEEAVGSGARGIVIGRNVWQRPPDVTRRLMARLHDIVHPSSDDDAPLTA